MALGNMPSRKVSLPQEGCVSLPPFFSPHLARGPFQLSPAVSGNTRLASPLHVASVASVASVACLPMRRRGSELPNENVWKSGNLAKPLNPGKPSIRIVDMQEIQGDAISLYRFISLQYSCLTCADSIHHLVFLQQTAGSYDEHSCVGNLVDYCELLKIKT